VGFRAGVSAADSDTTLRGHGAASLERIRGTAVERVRVSAAALEGVERALARHPAVKFVERNRRVPASFTPNDPYYSSAWHLPRIAAPTAWDLTQGTESVVIAIVDTGVDPRHPELASKLLPGYNVLTGTSGTADTHGHGTAVAGAAAAIGNNGTGTAGIAWRSAVLPVVVADASGYAYYSTIATGIAWAADHGARVINVSFADVAASGTIASAAQYAMAKGAVVVAAAGNCGCQESTPENPYIVSVGATDKADTLASFSSRGLHVDLAAPGVNVLTTAKGGGYMWGNGTSLASPLVSGVVALMMAANPTLLPVDVVTLVKANAQDLGTAGWDPSFGHGRLDASRAVAAAAASAPRTDLSPPDVEISSPAPEEVLGGTVPVNVAAFDSGGIARVELYVDDVLVASDTTFPYGFAWDTTTVLDGSHRLTSRAVDQAGNVGVSSTVSVTVRNTSDTTAPRATITRAATSGPKLTVSVSATDDVMVTRLDLLVDGKPVRTASTAPYTFTVKVRAGTHTVQAVAYDGAGNSGVSSPVVLTTTAGK
jgi:hypothetical protein